MSEPTNKLPWGSIGMIGLVLLLELAVARSVPEFTRSDDWDWRERGQEARSSLARSDVLAFGDSVIKWGIAPPLLEARLGRTVYSFAIPRGQVVASYFLLRRALAVGATPRALIIDSLPPLLAGEPEFRTRRWAELLDWHESAELALALQKPDVLTLLALKRLLPVLRYREDLRAEVSRSLRGEANDGRLMLFFHRRNWRANRGGVVIPERPFTLAENELTTWYRANYGGPWACHPTNSAYLHKFLDLAAGRSIPVFWVMTPFHAAYQALLDETQSDAPFEQFIAGLLQEYPNLTVLDARHSGYEPGAFCDGIHLNRLGNGRLSADVADCLAARLTQTGATGSAQVRWVRLPAYRPAPREGLAEDVEQSRLAVLELWARQGPSAAAAVRR